MKFNSLSKAYPSARSDRRKKRTKKKKRWSNKSVYQLVKLKFCTQYHLFCIPIIVCACVCETKVSAFAFRSSNLVLQSFFFLLLSFHSFLPLLSKYLFDGIKCRPKWQKILAVKISLHGIVVKQQMRTNNGHQPIKDETKFMNFSTIIRANACTPWVCMHGRSIRWD